MTQRNSKTDAAPRIALGLVVLLRRSGPLLGLTAPSASGVAATVIGKVGEDASRAARRREGDDPTSSRRLEGLPGGRRGDRPSRSRGRQDATPSRSPLDGPHRRLEHRPLPAVRERARVLPGCAVGRPDVEEGVGWAEPSARISDPEEAQAAALQARQAEPSRCSLAVNSASSPVFTLAKPLSVKRGTVVAMTTAELGPNFAHDEPVADPERRPVAREPRRRALRRRADRAPPMRTSSPLSRT